MITGRHYLFWEKIISFLLLFFLCNCFSYPSSHRVKKPFRLHLKEPISTSNYLFQSFKNSVSSSSRASMIISSSPSPFPRVPIRVPHAHDGQTNASPRPARARHDGSCDADAGHHPHGDVAIKLPYPTLPCGACHLSQVPIAFSPSLERRQLICHE